jgi:hypothetical protein
VYGVKKYIQSGEGGISGLHRRALDKENGSIKKIKNSACNFGVYYHDCPGEDTARNYDTKPFKTSRL